MSDQRHSPTPWSVETSHSGARFIGFDGQPITKPSDYRHAAACVNRFAGHGLASSVVIDQRRLRTIVEATRVIIATARFCMGLVVTDDSYVLLRIEDARRRITEANNAIHRGAPWPENAIPDPERVREVVEAAREVVKWQLHGTLEDEEDAEAVLPASDLAGLLRDIHTLHEALSRLGETS